MWISAAKIMPPSLKASVTRQGIVVQVKASRGLVRKMHHSLFYNVFVVHANKTEVRMNQSALLKEPRAKKFTVNKT